MSLEHWCLDAFTTVYSPRRNTWIIADIYSYIAQTVCTDTRHVLGQTKTDQIDVQNFITVMELNVVFFKLISCWHSERKIFSLDVIVVISNVRIFSWHTASRGLCAFCPSVCYIFFCRLNIVILDVIMLQYRPSLITSLDYIHGPMRQYMMMSSNIWWRHRMEAFSALLALCAGNSPVTGEFPSQGPVTRGFDVSFYLRLNKRLSKQSWG